MSCSHHSFAKVLAADAKWTASVARARVHKERVIQRLKVFKVFKGPIPWEMLQAVDNSMTVVAGIINLSSPIRSQDRFA